MPKELPKFEDISPTRCLNLDERTAVSHFLGRDQAAARKLFEDNLLFYSDDLNWMGDKAFLYYFLPFAEVVLPRMATDIEAVACALMVIDCRLIHSDVAVLQPVKKELSKLMMALETFCATCPGANRPLRDNVLAIKTAVSRLMD